MKNFTFLKITLLAFAMIGTISAWGQNAWINEIHYDNTSTDADEFIEVVIENAGSYTLSDFTVTLYNGNGGAKYDTKTIDAFTQGTSYGDFTIFYYNYTANGSSIQNGSPDGIALDYQGTLIQFLSYEGSFAATDGAAIGVTSTDIGVEEISSAIGESLQLSGTTGSNYNDFTWQAPAAATMGTVNNGQTFNTSSGISSATNKNIAIKVTNGKMQFNATGGEKVQVFNALGQVVTSTVAKPGVNSITVSSKGLVIVKIGNQIAKIIL